MQFCEIEMMDGENKYHAEGHGLQVRPSLRLTFMCSPAQIVSLQDAKKGIIFVKFPPVLMLQLKRFE